MDGITMSGMIRVSNEELKPCVVEPLSTTNVSAGALGEPAMLNEMGSEQTSGGSGVILFTTVVGSKQQTEPCSEEETEQEEAVQKDVELAEEVANRMTEEEYEALQEEGMTLEKYSIERFSRALERIKVQKELKQDGIEGQKEQLAKTTELAKRAAKKAIRDAGISDAVAERIMEQLQAVNLPITESNVCRIAESMKMADECRHLTEASFSYLLKNKLEPTIENVYKAVHSGTCGVRTLTETAFEQLRPAVESVITQGGWQVDSRMLTEAKQLLEGEIPLTTENLTYRHSLEELVTSPDPEVLLEETVHSLAKAVAPKQTNLLRVVQLTRVREEARLRLTVQTTGKMQKAGVTADVDGIERRVEDLKKQEENYYRQLMQETGLTGQNDRDLLSDTMAAVERLRVLPAALLAETLKTSDIQTITSLRECGERILRDNVAQKALDTYEALMTAPRKDMGDSVQKAFTSVDTQLSRLQLETTESNRRAVRILGYQQMPITVENVEQMKDYDRRVTGLIERMSPPVTCELIKRQINPLTTPIMQLSEQVDGLIGELGPSTEETYAQYLVNLDQKKELSPQERNAYIGIFRLLYQIEKTDGAAIGAIVRSGRELTFQNLLTEVRTVRHRKVDVTIDQTFGEVLDTVSHGERIDAQIEDAFHGCADNYQEIQQLLLHCEKEVTFLNGYGIESTIGNLIAAKELLEGDRWFKRFAVSKEELADALDHKEGMQAITEKLVQNAEELKNRIYLTSSLSTDEVAQLQQMIRGVNLSRELCRREYYEIPVQDENGTTTLNVTILHEEKNKGEIIIKTMINDHQVSVVGTMKEGVCNLLFTTDDREVSDRLKRQQEQLQAALKEDGFEADQMFFGVEERGANVLFPSQPPKEAPGAEQEVTEVQDLYRAAKSIVLYIGAMR